MTLNIKIYENQFIEIIIMINKQSLLYFLKNADPSSCSIALNVIRNLFRCNKPCNCALKTCFSLRFRQVNMERTAARCRHLYWQRQISNKSMNIKYLLLYAMKDNK